MQTAKLWVRSCEIKDGSQEMATMMFMMLMLCLISQPFHPGF